MASSARQRQTYSVVAASVAVVLAFSCAEVTGSEEAQEKPFTLGVTPAALVLNPGVTQQFTARVMDRAGNAVSGLIEWSASGGTISSEGLYTAGDIPGTYEVVAQERGRGVADTAGVSISLGSGALEITTSTTGSQLDPDGYSVTVDGSGAQSVGINDRVTFSDLAAGDHEVSLSGLASNCSVGGNPRTVTVSDGGTAQTTFGVTCGGAGGGGTADIYEWDFESVGGPFNDRFGLWVGAGGNDRPAEDIQALRDGAEAAQGEWYASTFNWGFLPYTDIPTPNWKYNHKLNEGSEKSVYVRFRFRVKSERTPTPFPFLNDANPKICRFFDPQNDSFGHLVLLHDGRMRWVHSLGGSGGAESSETQTIFNNTWHWIEVFFESNPGGRPRVRVWVDGVLDIDLTSTNTNSRNQLIGQTRLMWAGGQPSPQDDHLPYNLHFHFDQIALATFRLGIP